MKRLVTHGIVTASRVTRALCRRLLVRYRLRLDPRPFLFLYTKALIEELYNSGSSGCSLARYARGMPQIQPKPRKAYIDGSVPARGRSGRDLTSSGHKCARVPKEQFYMSHVLALNGPA